MQPVQLPQLPPFYNALSPSDRQELLELRSHFFSSECRYNRNKRIDSFSKMLDTIKSFCQRGNNDDSIRYLACGIFWCEDDIIVNTRQLCSLLGKSKSSVNGAFVKLGYDTVILRESGSDHKIPFLRSNQCESRQWTIRRKRTQSDEKDPKKWEIPMPERLWDIEWPNSDPFVPNDIPSERLLHQCQLSILGDEWQILDRTYRNDWILSRMLITRK